MHLKTRQIPTDRNREIGTIESVNPNFPSHLLLQFRAFPTPETVAALQNRGVQVLADVPVNGLLVAVQGTVDISDLGVNHAQTILGADKVSPLIGQSIGQSIGQGHSSRTAARFFVVEFHSDADMNQARALLLALAGVEIIQNPDLHPSHLLIHITPPAGATQAAILASITALEPVAYVFPASTELASRTPSRPYTAALTTNGAAVQSIPTYGDGWDGPGLGSATLTYVFSGMTSQLPAGTVQAEIQRAMAEWSKVVNVKWQLGSNPNGSKTVNIMFAQGAHGDGFPFDGRGGVLAHTFYPAPPNPEPLAGDMHFDDSEHWSSGNDTDLFSAALHELGHALGLGHSDDPTAVMYPYYRMATMLAAPDKAAILTLYAPASSTPAQAAPLSLTVNAAPVATTAATVSLSGLVSGGSGAVTLTWSTNSGAQGTATGTASWNIASIPLVMGSNTISLTAMTGAARASQVITITRQTVTSSGGNGNGSGAGSGGSGAPPPTVDKTAPTLTITSPSSATITSASAAIGITGTASDNVGVTSVTWANNFGASGTASGTANWSTSVPLLTGSNTITIRAFDAAGNSSWRSVVITRR